MALTKCLVCTHDTTGDGPTICLLCAADIARVVARNAAGVGQCGLYGRTLAKCIIGEAQLALVNRKSAESGVRSARVESIPSACDCAIHRARKAESNQSTKGVH